MSIIDKFKLDGKIALVTGCSRGIGFGIAQALAEAGCWEQEILWAMVEQSHPDYWWTFLKSPLTNIKATGVSTTTLQWMELKSRSRV